MIARKRKARSLRSRPYQNAILKTEVGWRIKLLARHNNADNGLAASVLYLDILVFERNLHAFILYLIIDNGGLVDVACTDGASLGLDNEEVLQRLCAVHRESEVCEVVTELHRLIMNAINPTAKHGNFGSRVSTKRVTCIAEVLERNGLLGLSGIHVFSNAGTEQKFASMCIIHQQLDGAQGTIILTNDKSTWSPSPCIVIHSKTVLIRAVNEALVFPTIAPRVGNNPGSYLIFFNLSDNAVSVKVELNAVVISANGKSMIECIAPRLHILHAYHTGSFVGCGVGNSSPCAVSSHANTSNAASVHRFISTMIVEPFLQLLSAFGSVGRRKTEVVSRLIPHGTIPLVIALHPAIIGVVVRLWSEESAVGSSAISGNIGNAYSFCHSFCCAGLISQQPSEVRRILILGQRSINITIAVNLMRELIAYGCSRATRTAILIEDGREILILPVIDIRRQLRLTFCFASFASSHIIGWQVRTHVILKVGKDTTVYLYHFAVGKCVFLYLRPSIKSRHKTCYQKKTLQVSHNIIYNVKKGSLRAFPEELPLLID